MDTARPPTGGAWRLVQRLGPLSLFVGFLAWAGWYLWTHVDQLRDLSLLSTQDAAVVLGLNILSTVIEGVLLRLVVRAYGIKLSFGESAALFFVSRLANHLTPLRGGGIGVRAVHLKHRHGLSYEHFASMTAGQYVIAYLAYAAMGLAELAAIHWVHDIASRPLAVAFALGFAALIIITAPSVVPQVKARWFRPFAKVLEGWQRLRRDRGVLLGIATLSVAASLTRIAGLYVCFRASGITLPILGAALASTMADTFAVIAVTPGGFGITEAGIVLGTQPFGVGIAHTVAASFIYRLTIYAAALPTGLLASYLLWGRGALRRLFETDSGYDAYHPHRSS